MFTPSDGLEWTPILTGDGNAVAFISATSQRPPLPVIMQLNGSSNFKLLGEDLIPSEFLTNKLITPKQVIFKSPDGIIVCPII